MKTILKHIVLPAVFISCFCCILPAQDRQKQIPQFDVTKEKFSVIKERLEEFLKEEEEEGEEEPGNEFCNSSIECEEDEGPARHIKNWLREMDLHQDSSGYIINTDKANADAYFNVLKNQDLNKNGFNSTASVTNGAWTNLSVNNIVGPAWGQGRVNCLAIEPGNANVIYAGANEGGLWKTTNGGAAWHCITNHLPIPGISSIVINPANSSQIYILTGNRRNNFPLAGSTAAAFTDGVYISNDGGNNWYKTILPFLTSTTTAGALRMSPTNSNILVACTSIGIYRTTNGGADWGREIQGNFDDLEFKPGTQTCYASTPNSIYKSIDNGHTWNLVTNAAFPLFNPPPASSQVVEIAVTPASPGVVYLYFYGGSVASVYKSNNSGGNFTFQSDVTSFANVQPGYCSALGVSPANASVVYLGNFIVSKSTDNGVNFFDAWTGGFHADQQDILVLSNDTAIVANDGGVYKTTNSGIPWVFCSVGIYNSQYMGFGGYPTNQNLFVGGMWDNGTMQYNAGTLTGLVFQDMGDAMIKASNPDTVYVVTENDKHYLRRRIGSTEVDISAFNSCNCYDTMGGPSNKIIYQNPLNPNTIYSIYGDFYISYNAGNSWIRKIRNNIPAWAMAQGVNDTSRIYIIEDNAVWASADYGNTWTSIYTHNTNLIYDIIVNTANKNEFYFSCKGYLNSGKVFKGVWNGPGNIATISDISAFLLPFVPVYKLAYQNTSTPGIYAGTEIGIFFRELPVGQWQYFGGGMPVCRAVDLEINYAAGVITAATYGRGLWQSPLYSACPQTFDHGNYYALGIPYANPPVAGTEVFYAADSIHSSVFIEGGAGVSVKYVAGNVVALTDSFEVKEGCSFYAEIGNCMNPTTGSRLMGNYAGELPHDYQNPFSSVNNGFTIHVMPNPADKNLSVRVEKSTCAELQMDIIDLTGRSQVQKNIASSPGEEINLIEFNISNLSNGVYFLKVQCDLDKSISKFIIQH